MAMEIDSARDENIDKIITRLSSFFLTESKWENIFFKIFIGEGMLLFLKSIFTIFIFFLIEF